MKWGETLCKMGWNIVWGEMEYCVRWVEHCVKWGGTLCEMGVEHSV